MKEKDQKNVIKLKIPSIKLPSTKVMSKVLIPLSIIVSGILISVSLIAIGSTINNTLKNANTLSSNTTTSQPAITPSPQQQKASVTLDQVRNMATSGKYITTGNTSSKLAFIEFSDESCPFCHFAGGLDSELGKQSAQFTLVKD